MRALIEIIEPDTCDQGHVECLLRIGASWPQPHPYADLDEPLAT